MFVQFWSYGSLCIFENNFEMCRLIISTTFVNNIVELLILLVNLFKKYKYFTDKKINFQIFKFKFI